ncbi:1-phosphofructokinase family hexose kinase [Mycolicibacterium sp. 050158]|uniref:1-phosphofructokinase family hexose kinase n=1 Tax=Mycolicibacterium sp. 050158 TaxID=3090602 RepID=UPI00299E8F75|nr:1-phosphofructokinase family hexose kinase [Mycolicibacterium sp. 050158]MDX1890799.1 1-phosphofructokinase family hexose kinase [Mycolicibacterium sp. 050158]
MSACAGVEDAGARIVTLTMNPALDVCASTAVVRPTDKVRCSNARYDAGGGGVNVARVARALGISTSAVFPSGGPTGALVTRLAIEADVCVHAVDIAEPTRESFTVDETTTSRQYRFVLPGPCLTVAEQARCLGELRRTAAGATFVVASGSLPPGVPADFYQRVADVCRELAVPLILDTSGCGLAGVSHGVFLMKPSVRELREHAGRALDTEADRVAAAREFVDRGAAEAVVVSLGAEGALLVTATESQRFEAIPVHSRSGVGAGDAMVAGITVGLVRGRPLADAVRLGIAASAAMLTTSGTTCPARREVDRVLGMVREPVDVTPLSA